MDQANFIISKFKRANSRGREQIGISALAELLKITPSTVDGWKRRGVIPPNHWQSIISVSDGAVTKDDFLIGIFKD